MKKQDYKIGSHENSKNEKKLERSMKSFYSFNSVAVELKSYLYGKITVLVEYFVVVGTTGHVVFVSTV
jgi:hypothetical protein